MLKICNCIKTVPDMDKVADAEWASATGACRCDFSYVPKILDPYCESAAELVLRMMDGAAARASGSADVKADAGGSAAGSGSGGSAAACEDAAICADALTIGDKIAEKPLRTLAALGYSGVYRIDEGESGPTSFFDPARIAKLIASFCKSRSYDVIIFGMESYDEGSRLVPFLAAELLGMPCLTDVTAMAVAGSKIRVTHREGNRIVEETVRTPLVLTVGDVPSCLLRVPTLRQRSAAAKNKVRLIDAASLFSAAPLESARPDTELREPMSPTTASCEAGLRETTSPAAAPCETELRETTSPEAAPCRTEPRAVSGFSTSITSAPRIMSPALLSLSLIDQSRQAVIFDGPAADAASQILEILQQSGVLKNASAGKGGLQK